MESIKNLLESRNINGIVTFMKEHNLKIENNRIVAADNESQINLKKNYEFYDQRQLIKKILLNS